ncbi:MAG: peptidase C45 [Planctomycetes bacterium]|nr:peptidase C45 [Planctomycetota bacterium]
MSTPARYPELTIAGAPRQMGRQLGEAAGETIRTFFDKALEQLDKRMRLSRERAMNAAARAIPLAEAYSPDSVEELRGMAEASGLSLEALMLLQIRNQFRPLSDEGCTSFALQGHGPRHGGGIVAQNWDNDPGLDRFTIVLTRRPADKPALLNLTQAGLIAYIGFNAAGIGVCLNSLPAPMGELGVPHYFTVRGIYGSDSLSKAVERVRQADRVIPANLMLITPQGPADLEVTIDAVHVLQNAATQGLAHANHCLHPDLLATNDQFPELIQSHARQRRINRLINFEQSRDLTVDDAKRALADHDGHPRSICRHANDDPETGDWQTVFSVVMEPSAGRMHVTRGTPCDHPYEVYQLG